MLAYFDNCCLQRPFDDHTQLRIALESECVMAAFALAEGGHLDIVSSEALMYEIAKIPDIQRKAFVIRALSCSRVFVRVTDEIEARAAQLSGYGLRNMDALHIACAEAAAAQFFCSCDDGILQKAGRIPGLGTQLVTPQQLIEEMKK
ncbi:MAG: PIN domain-containing protein [Candidatus Sumerlaeota bacterium]|nr:PIN domain-containing protein [Candidatus Sumerlaeota bacterium]